MRHCRECATKMGDKFPYPLEMLPIRNMDRKPKEEEPVPKKARKASPTGAEIAASSLAHLIYEGEVSEEVAQCNENILLLPDVGAKLELDPSDWNFALEETYTAKEYVKKDNREHTSPHFCGGWHYSTNSDYAYWDKSEHVTEKSRRQCNHYLGCPCLPTKVDESHDIDLYCPHFMDELKLKNPR